MYIIKNPLPGKVEGKAINTPIVNQLNIKECIMLAEKIKEIQGAKVINMPDFGKKSFIQNEFFEAVAKNRIPGEQMQVLSAIIRKTWCWGKDKDRISASQIIEYTGLKKQNVHRSIQELITKKVIRVIKNDYSNTQEIEINRDYDSWAQSSKKITSSKVITGVIKNDDKTSSKVMDTKDNKDTLTKDIKNSSCPGFENPDEEAEKIQPEQLLKKSKKYIFEESHTKLSELLASEILKNKPDFKLPANLNEWSDCVRLMIERDKRSPAEVEAVILWCQQDQFWKNNILSMAAIRKQFDRLQMKMKSKPVEYHKKSTCPMTNYVTPKDLKAEAAKYDISQFEDPEEWLK